MIYFPKNADKTDASQTRFSFSLSIWQKVAAFIFLFAGALFAYRDALDVMVPTDSFSLLFTFKTFGVKGLLHNFYDVGLYPVSDSITFLLYKLFGINATGWIITSLFFHSINAFLVFLVSLRLYAPFLLNSRFLLSFVSALLFLLSPFQTEVVLWSPREINYLIAVMFVLLSCYYMINYSQGEKRIHLVLFHLFFILAVLSFESSLSFPAIPVFYFLLQRFIHGNSVRIKTILMNVLLPQGIILFLYFLTCKVWLGDWILHYGSVTHLNFTISIVAGNIIKYLAKFFLFYRYLPDSRYEFLHNILHTDIQNDNTMWFLFFLAILVMGFLFFRFFRNNKSNAAMLLFLFLAFLITLIPIINLDTSFLGAVISDRYGYLPSVFFYMFLSGLVYVLFKKIWILVSCGLIVICCICLSQTIPLWTTASNYSARLMKNFKPYLSEQNIFVLNMPDNCNWILTYRDGFSEAADFIYGSKPRHIEETAGFYMTSPEDSVKVSYDGFSGILVESAPHKQSFLYNGKWAQSYKKEEYFVTFNPGLSAYTLMFNDGIPDDAIILYIAGDKWRKVKL